MAKTKSGGIETVQILSDRSVGKSGVYKSDNMELILSHPLKNFGPEDTVIFDVDDVLITQRFDPFYVEHAKKETPLHNKFLELERHIRQKFFLYLFVTSEPFLNISLMDECIPTMIKELQSKGICCLGNTAAGSIIGTNKNFDLASARVSFLKDFGIDFSSSFFHLSSWGSLRERTNFFTSCYRH